MAPLYKIPSPIDLAIAPLVGKSDVVVVQIGSNDGKSGDPLFPYLKANKQWRSVLVEPVPYLMRKLRQTHGRSRRFRYEMAAIGEQEGRIPFFFISPAAGGVVANLPGWYEQLGSFFKSHLLDHCGDAIEPFIIRQQVKVLPLQVVLDKHHVSHIDVMHVDTEGSDWIVLKQLDLRRYRPAVILVEYKHLSRSHRNCMYRHVRDRYDVVDLGADYLCLRREKDDRADGSRSVAWRAGGVRRRASRGGTIAP